MKRVLSGIQPTGNVHLGNYLGAISQWVKMQKEYEELLFCIVDLHAITVPQDPEALRRHTRETAAIYIACGIDPKNAAIFHQSAVREHTELAWILSCNTPMGWLNRMTQFKEKAGKKKEQAPLGLYGYPVLMAADILLYQATHVPVGEDQKQHLELTRDIAMGFNHTYKQEFFTLPEPMILGEATRVMSLRDGMNKMSKSDPSEYSRITLHDDADTITKKIKKAKSDMEPTIYYSKEGRPEVSNLINIYAAVSGESRQQVEDTFRDKGAAVFKTALADLLVNHLEPIRTEIIKLRDDQAYLDSILKEGAEKARTLAAKHMQQVRDIIGLL